MTHVPMQALMQAAVQARNGVYALLADGYKPYNPMNHPKAPGPVRDKIHLLMDLLGWIAGAIAVVGVIVAAISMFVSHHRGGGSEHMTRLGYVAGGIVLMATASSIVGFVMK